MKYILGKKKTFDYYQNKQPSPLTNARQVGEGRHLITFQTATEPA